FSLLDLFCLDAAARDRRCEDLAIFVPPADGHRLAARRQAVALRVRDLDNEVPRAASCDLYSPMVAAIRDVFHAAGDPVHAVALTGVEKHPLRPEGEDPCVTGAKVRSVLAEDADAVGKLQRGKAAIER